MNQLSVLGFNDPENLDVGAGVAQIKACYVDEVDRAFVSKANCPDRRRSHSWTNSRADGAQQWS